MLTDDERTIMTQLDDVAAAYKALPPMIGHDSLAGPAFAAAIDAARTALFARLGLRDEHAAIQLDYVNELTAATAKLNEHRVSNGDQPIGTGTWAGPPPPPPPEIIPVQEPGGV